jgi:hypothetical protein
MARRVSTRTILRLFQAVRGPEGDPQLLADLELLWHKDLDLSIKAGALLAFDGLILTAGVNPLTSSPGAPLSLDPNSAAAVVALTALGVVLLAIAAMFCVRGIMVGEDFDDSGIEHDPNAVTQRMLAAHCAAIDAQGRLLAWASRFTYAGGAVMAAAFLLTLADKWI